MIKRLILVLLVLGLIFGGIFGWKYYQQWLAAQNAKPPAPAHVASTQVQVETWRPYLHAVGSLVASQGVSVTTEIEGQVKKIFFKSGQPVKQDDLLLQLDDDIDQAQLRGLQAERQLAELRFKRTSELFQKGSVPRENYDEAQTQLDSATAQVAAKQAELEKKKIFAPFSGLLGIRQVDLGEYLSPGAKIVPLQAIDPIYVDYTLPERYFAELSADQQIILTVQAYPDQSFRGRITALNPGIDPGTRSVRIRATLSNSEGHLRPGMFAEVRTLLPQRQNILTLPRTAITYNPYGDSVFVIQEKDGALIVQRQQVQTGETRNERVEIVKGLQAGERVVSAGQVKLRNGQKVQIDNSVALDQSVPSS